MYKMSMLGGKDVCLTVSDDKSEDEMEESAQWLVGLTDPWIKFPIGRVRNNPGYRD
jgi:hypothetical protein